MGKALTLRCSGTAIVLLLRVTDDRSEREGSRKKKTPDIFSMTQDLSALIRGASCVCLSKFIVMLAGNVQYSFSIEL